MLNLTNGDVAQGNRKGEDPEREHALGVCEQQGGGQSSMK